MLELVRVLWTKGGVKRREGVGWAGSEKRSGYSTHFCDQSSHRSMADVQPRPLGDALGLELHGRHGPCCWPDRPECRVHERGPRRIEEKARDIDGWINEKSINSGRLER